GRGALRTDVGGRACRWRHDDPVHLASGRARRRNGRGAVMPGTRVLVVDDEPAILRTVRANLGRRGFQVEVATSGEDAIALSDRQDLIVLDLGLPDRDGLDVIRSIRARSKTPIIVLSVRDSEREQVRALDLGADDYVTKPFGVEELVARVRVALRHADRPEETDDVFRNG